MRILSSLVQLLLQKVAGREMSASNGHSIYSQLEIEDCFEESPFEITKSFFDMPVTRAV